MEKKGKSDENRLNHSTEEMKASISRVDISTDAKAVNKIELDRGASLLVGVGEKPLHGQDTTLVDLKNKTFGVFDGMGGRSEGALRAAEVARQAFVDMPDSCVSPKDVLESMEATLWLAHEEIIETVNVRRGDNGNEYGGTTATVAKVFTYGNQTYLAWVSVGDSRIYLIEDRDMHSSIPIQLSQDEGHENILENCLGWRDDAFRGLRQQGSIALNEKMRFIINTDGVTGDRGAEIVGPHELGMAIFRKNTQEAADILVSAEVARKEDDRSALVIDYSPEYS